MSWTWSDGTTNTAFCTGASACQTNSCAHHIVILACILQGAQARCAWRKGFSRVHRPFNTWRGNGHMPQPFCQHKRCRASCMRNVQGAGESLRGWKACPPGRSGLFCPVPQSAAAGPKDETPDSCKQNAFSTSGKTPMQDLQ